MYLLGIDIGTTNWKAVLYTYSGETVARSVTPTITHHAESGSAVYHVEDIWQGVCTLCQDILAQCRKEQPAFQPEQIRGVAITGMGEAMVPLDAQRQPLYEVIAWFDPRTEPQARWLEEQDPEARIFRTTGLSFSPIYSLCKLLWIREHEPAIFEKAVKWLTMPDFVMFKLSGEYATDYSEASRTLCFDITRKTWSPELLDLAGLDASVLPPAYCGGTMIGRVHQRASQETGLASGTPVVTGGHDHICGALAVGAFQGNVMLNSCGTTESLVLSLPTLSLGNLPPDQQLTHGCHVARDMYYMITGIYVAGAELQRFKNLFAGEADDDAVWQQLMDEARQAGAGSDGVLFLPHSRGANVPPLNPRSCSALLGLRAHHQRGHIIRAVIEGLCYETRRLLTIMEQQAGTSVDLLRVAGSARNTFWLQVKADVLNKSIEVPKMTEGSCLGAAMLAGIGADIYRDENDAFRQIYRSGDVYEPNQEYTAWYDECYQEIFTNIYPALVPVYHKRASVYFEKSNK
ncbi:carbohydrate kinase, FGGY [Candidatus Vecturithrix granuli]|uniref:Carbohydrate kinase, FGGY n=1 Tax=Vecturithrix granuli TaxID=1499967 RepID=A0A081BX09_VECG1|nr:carbohydrate kinase, FGGY [Candidatus Vecturithrix granuli]